MVLATMTVGISGTSSMAGRIPLTAQQRADIKRYIQQGVAPKTVAYMYGKHTNTIYRIINNETWKNTK